jgi:hypothetical protein
MIKAVLHIQKYFQTPKDYFWRWGENGEVIEWKNGSTICYRDDLILLLTEMSSKGFPSFSSLLLLLSACKKELHTQEEFFLLRTLNEFNHEDTKAVFDEAIRFIHVVNALPPELKTGKARAHLIYEVFRETGFIFSNVNMKEALNELNSGRIDQLILEPTEEITKEQFIADLKCLSDALKRFPTTESLVLRLKTGLDILPRKAEIDLPENTPQDLLDQLAEDSKTAGIARLTKRIVAALNIPMHSSISGGHSYGGITDIINRGNYDKLLLSELAHDNDLLTARLVNNEALYFKREEPPDNPKRQRTILVDITLKMWGIPRVFAVSAALAFAYNVKHEETIETYALGGNIYKEMRLDTKEGIIRSLEILDVSLHCGTALQSVINEVSATEHNDFIFITDKELFRQPGFHAAFSGVKEMIGFIVTISREGDLCFYECKKGRTKVISTAKFDLEELLFAPPGITKPKKEYVHKETPAFLFQTPSPLLLPKVRIKAIGNKVFFSEGFGFVVVNESQRVLYIPRERSGGQELLNFIEKGEYAFGQNDPWDLYIIVKNLQRNFFKFYHIDFRNDVSDSINLSDEIQFARQVVFHENKFYIETDFASFSFDCISKEVADKKSKGSFSQMFHPAGPHNLKNFDHDTISKYIYPYDRIMYKIKELYISQEGKLVLGNYTLDLIREKAHARIVENVIKQTGIYYTKEVGVNRSLLSNKNIKFTIRKWDDGSEAIIDSRGLLHLKSSDPSIPEISIVLVTGACIAFWASDGIVAGASYFIRENEESTNIIPVRYFYEKYIQRFIDKIVNG